LKTCGSNSKAGITGNEILSLPIAVQVADNRRLVKVINMIDWTLKWPLLSGVPLERWVSTSGKVLIVGDAAHPMLPYMSEGMHFDIACFGIW
jgi:2-polyprenyl-6-methoxyphenol hydroxylase-like FAD-dependent oxidoreductase